MNKVNLGDMSVGVVVGVIFVVIVVVGLFIVVGVWYGKWCIYEKVLGRSGLM